MYKNSLFISICDIASINSRRQELGKSRVISLALCESMLSVRTPTSVKKESNWPVRLLTAADRKVRAASTTELETPDGFF